LLAEKLKTTIVPITHKYFRHDESLDAKKAENVKPLLDKGVKNTIFIYDYSHVYEFWEIIKNNQLSPLKNKFY